MIQYRRGLVVLSLAAFVVTQLFAAPVIGVATTRGTMEVDNAAVRGTANLTDGSSVRTNATAGQLQLNNGIQATLAGNSAAKIYATRLELQTGAGQATTKEGFNLEALGFRIAPTADKAIARVSYERPDRILVTAVDSGLKVSKNGILLTRLNAGTTYYFEPPSAEQDNTAQSAGKTSGQNNSGKSGAKTGLSTAAKWGIVAGVAGAGTAIGLGVALSGDDASR